MVFWHMMGLAVFKAYKLYAVRAFKRIFDPAALFCYGIADIDADSTFFISHISDAADI